MARTSHADELVAETPKASKSRQKKSKNVSDAPYNSSKKAKSKIITPRKSARIQAQIEDISEEDAGGNYATPKAQKNKQHSRTPLGSRASMVAAVSADKNALDSAPKRNQENAAEGAANTADRESDDEVNVAKMSSQYENQIVDNHLASEGEETEQEIDEMFLDTKERQKRLKKQMKRLENESA